MNPNSFRAGFLKEILRNKPFYFLLMPTLAFYSVFVLYPLIDTFRLSLFEHPYWPDERFVGISNYIRILTSDTLFYRAFINNLQVLVLSMVGNAGTGLFLAVLLNSLKNERIRRIYLTMLFWPYMMMPVAVAKLFRRFYDPHFGLLNHFLESLGLQSWTRVWLGDPQSAVFCVWVACWWMSISINMLIFYAGLQGIDPALYEAAQIDGAGRLSSFIHITVPSLRSVIMVMFTLITIGAFKVFDIFWVLGGGSPLPAFFMVLATEQYDMAWFYNYFGYASALAVVMIIIILITTIIYLRIQEV